MPGGIRCHDDTGRRKEDATIQLHRTEGLYILGMHHTHHTHARTCIIICVCTHMHFYVAQVVGPAKYKKLVQVELNRVRCLPHTGFRGKWKDAGIGLEGRAYQAKYGDEWKEIIRETLGRRNNKVLNVTEIMDHVVVEGNRLFQDTPYKDNW